MKRKLILTIVMIALIVCAFILSASASDVFTLTSSVGDKQVGDTVDLYADGEGLVWYLDDENKLVSVKSSQLTLEFLAQDQPYTQVGKLPAVSGAPCLNIIKLGDTELQSISGEKRIVVANLRGLDFAYLYSNGSTLFANNNTLQCVYLPNTVKRLAEGAFMNCTALTSIDMGNSVQIIWDKVFYGANKLERIDCSVDCLYIGLSVFFGCSSLNELHLGASMLYLQGHFLDGTGNQQIDLYVPPTVTNFGAPYNNYLTIFFTGTVDQVGVVPTFGVVDFTYLPYSEFDGTRTEVALKWYLYYDTNECDAYYNSQHDANDDNDCTTALVCERCEKQLATAYKEHDKNIQIVYSNGYLSCGEKSESCKRCSYSLEEEAEALFVCNGYSIPEDNRISVAISYEINRNAIDEYKISNDGFEFGVFAVLGSKIGNNELFKEDGSITTKSICADLTNEELNSVTFKIFGFELEEHKSLELAMGVYTRETVDNKAKYSYLQAKEAAENQRYSLITYNDIA